MNMFVWWFRNFLKTTSPTKFELLKVYAVNADSSKICNELRANREALVNYFKSKNSNSEDAETVFMSYLSLLKGALFPGCDDGAGKGGTGVREPSAFVENIRKTANFSWNQSVCVEISDVSMDVAFEMVSVMFQAGLFFASNARTSMARMSEYDQQTCTNVFRTLKKAASIFKKSRELTNLFLSGTVANDARRNPSDLDERITIGYYIQCSAEALEVSVVTANFRKTDARPLCDIYVRMLNLYSEAAHVLCSFESDTSPQLAKWVTFINIKKEHSYFMAYLYLSECFLKLDKCGQAIRCCSEAVRGKDVIHKLVKQFNGIYANKCTESVPKDFLPKFVQRVDNMAEKLRYENSIIYHQQEERELPPLPDNPHYGNVEETEFDVEVSRLWTRRAYEGFSFKDA